MKLVIAGSRTFNDYTTLKRVFTDNFNKEEVTLIISGGASGADSLAERLAKELSIPLKVFKADWVKYGKSAGIIRNIEMIKEGDALLAFWDGISKGTKKSIQLANKKGIKTIVHKFK